MPSHPDRVRQNYCEHEWPHIDRDFFWMDDISDGRKCIKCGADWDNVHKTKFANNQRS